MAGRQASHADSSPAPKRTGPERAGQAAHGGEPPEPGDPRGDADRQRGQAELHVPLVVDRVRGSRRRAGWPGAQPATAARRSRGWASAGPAIKDATTPSAASPKTGQTRPGDPAQRCASATVSLPTDAVAVIQLSAFRCAYAMATRGTSSTTAASPAVSQPSGTPSSCRRLRLRDGGGGRRATRVRPASRVVPLAGRAPAGDEQRQPVGHHDQQPEEVEQAGEEDRCTVGGPPARPAVVDGAQQQVGSDRGQHGHDRVGARLLGVPDHGGQQREHGPGGHPGQRGIPAAAPRPPGAAQPAR